MIIKYEFPDFYEFTAYDFPENGHSDDGYFREKSYIGWIRKHLGIQPRYNFCDAPSKMKILPNLYVFVLTGFLVTLVFEEVTGKNVLLLPMGSCDDGAHSQNEKLNIVNYMEGTKVFAEYLNELGKL